MCKAFSCIVMRNGKVYWEAGVDSHDELIYKFKVRDDTTDTEEISHAKVEIIPNNKEKYPYLYPEKDWKFQVDERVRPSWLLPTHEKTAWDAFLEWKQIIYRFNIIEARKPFNPLFKIQEPTSEDIVSLKRWASVGASVGDSVRASVGDSVRASVWDSVRASVGDSVRDSVWDSVRASVWASVRDSVGDSVRDSVWASVGDSVWDSVGASVWASVRDSVGASVGAYIGSLFPEIKTWRYYEGEEKDYPYQSCVDLWKRGFVPSFDGKMWRLHSGKKAKIVYQISKEELCQ